MFDAIRTADHLNLSPASFAKYCILADIRSCQIQSKAEKAHNKHQPTDRRAGRGALDLDTRCSGPASREQVPQSES